MKHIQLLYIELILSRLLIIVAEFQFSQPTYNVTEGSEIVNICLELVNGTLAKDALISMSVATRQEDIAGCKIKKKNLTNIIILAFLQIFHSSRHHE